MAEKLKKLSLLSCSTLFGLLLLVLTSELLLDRRADLHPDFVTAADTGAILNHPNIDRLVKARLVRKEGFEPFSYPVTTDQFGCRVNGQEQARSGPNIVILGDSFSFGSHALFEETIQGRLATHFPQASVVNFAVPGSCSHSYPDQLKSYLALTTVKPSIVVVGLYVDPSLGDIPRRKAREQYGPYREIDGYSVSPETYQSAQSALGLALFRARVAGRRWSSLYNILFPAGSPQFSVPTPEPGDSEAEDILSSLRQICEISGLPPQAVVVHFIPTAQETISRAEANPKVLPLSPSEAFWLRLRGKLEELGHPVSDPRAALIGRFLQSKTYPFTADSHLNGHGFELVCEVMFEKIPKFSD